MSSVSRSFAAALAAALLASPGAARAATFTLDLVADGDGRYYEYFSDAFAQIDQPLGGSQVLDGFFQISALPAIVELGGGADVFPNESNFASVGSLEYDESVIVGGSGSAPITSLALDFDLHVADDDSILSAGYATSIDSVVGTVSAAAGMVTSIDLGADIVFTYDATSFGLGLLDYEG